MKLRQRKHANCKSRLQPQRFPRHVILCLCLCFAVGSQVFLLTNEARITLPTQSGLLRNAFSKGGIGSSEKTVTASSKIVSLTVPHSNAPEINNCKHFKIDKPFHIASLSRPGVYTIILFCFKGCSPCEDIWQDIKRFTKGNEKIRSFKIDFTPMLNRVKEMPESRSLEDDIFLDNTQRTIINGEGTVTFQEDIGGVSQFLLVAPTQDNENASQVPGKPEKTGYPSMMVFGPLGTVLTEVSSDDGSALSRPNGLFTTYDECRFAVMNIEKRARKFPRPLDLDDGTHNLLKRIN